MRKYHSKINQIRFTSQMQCNYTTHTLRPSFAVILRAQLVFLRTFFFPCGVNVDTHALHSVLPGGAVKQSTFGTLEEVPVPRKMSSIGLRLGLVHPVKSEDDARAISFRWETAKQKISPTITYLSLLNSEGELLRNQVCRSY
jgi:hypothetical protein